MMVIERFSSRYRWILPVFALLVLTPSTAECQWVGSIEQLEVALWPEYDRQAVLVIYRFRLKPDTRLPTTVALPTPAAVGQPQAVAWRDESGGLLVAESTRNVDGERATILINMPSLEGQLEYYADLTLEGSRRNFLFAWPGGVAADSFSYEVQRPVGVLQLEIKPPPDRQRVGGDGLTYAWVEHGPLEVTERPVIELSYEKESMTLTAQALQPSQPSNPSSPEPQVSTNGGTLPPWLPAAFGGLVLGLALSWYWWSSRKPPDTSHRPRPAKTIQSKEPAAGIGANFCYNCGTKTKSGANFCMSCGTKLRS
jgi:hypothetical protein